MERLFRYFPEDFREPAVRVLHMDLVFDMYDDHTMVTSHLEAKTRADPIGALSLNAKNLEMHEVNCDKSAIDYEYRKSEGILSISFSVPLPPGTRFTIMTRTTCRPTKNILEGLYYDETPPGAPPQQITQCQQWGFQRIVPCIDDMTAKCTYRTAIIADERYTHLISNGDVVEQRHTIGGGRARITYENVKTPMAPYLFFLGALTCASFTREFEYPDGKTFSLELLVPPGTDPVMAGKALGVLSDAVMWVHLFTGKGRYEQVDKKIEIFRLTRERDELKAVGGEPEKLKTVRSHLQALVKTVSTGYTYTGTAYREIGMQNSDFGGMENVGNTTISTNRIMPFPQMTDSAYEYMIGVKVHEYYHNLNGSEVTGKTPFELWLNEAVTVFVEYQHHAFLFGEGYSRLKTVLSFLSPEGGTLALDASVASAPIEPDGFDDPNDLITGITYVKAPEFVRMVETFMGKEQFVRALALYHSRYHHGNATWQQWVEVMEEVSGQSFRDMAHAWLKQTGYPRINVKSTYDSRNRSLTLFLSQSGSKTGEPWIFPFNVVLVDREGRDIREITARIDSAEKTLIFEDVDEPAFISLNREYSCFGKVFFEVAPEQLLMQVRKDRDLINRYVAYYRLLDAEKMRLIVNPDAKPSDTVIDLMYELVSDEDLMQDAGGQFLTVFESVDDETYTHRYQALFDTKRSIMRSFASKYQHELSSLYTRYAQKGSDDEISAIKARQVKNFCLSTLSLLDNDEVRSLVKEQFLHPSCMTDKLVAFMCYLEGKSPDRQDIINKFEIEAKSHPVSWEAFLVSIAGTSAPDLPDLMRRVEKSDHFRIEQSNDQRALYGRFAMNRKRSLQTAEGREYFREIITKLAIVNEFSTVNMLRVFGNIELMEEEYHVPLVTLLVTILEELDPGRTPSVYNTIRRLLAGAPKAVQEYESSYGKISARYK